MTPSRKRPPLGKGKGLTEPKSKKTKRDVSPRTQVRSSSSSDGPTLPAVTETTYNDVSSSAVLFSKVTCARDQFPPPDTLSENKAYAEVALRGVKFITHLNKMILRYEETQRKDRARVDEARKDATELKSKLSKAEESFLPKESKPPNALKALNRSCHWSRSNATRRISRSFVGRLARLNVTSI